LRRFNPEHVAGQASGTSPARRGVLWLLTSKNLEPKFDQDFTHRRQRLRLATLPCKTRYL
ncbi:MAG: hypothetical protein AB4372_09990, partial [Xenococcus sp. (in: cyanobacteria)]